MPLKSSDIALPKVAGPGSGRRTTSTAKLSRVLDPRGDALGDVASGTRQLAAATAGLGQNVKQGGQILATATERQGDALAKGLQDKALQVNFASRVASEATNNYNKTVGVLSDVFAKLELDRSEASEKIASDTATLEVAKATASLPEEYKAHPGSTPEAIEAVNKHTMEVVLPGVLEKVRVAMGGAPLTEAMTAQITSMAMATSASVVRQVGAAHYNAGVDREVALVKQNMIATAVSVISGGPEVKQTALDSIDHQALALEGLSTPDVIDANVRAAKEAVDKAEMQYHLNQGNPDAAAEALKGMVGGSGTGATPVTAAAVASAKARGLDDLAFLGMMSFETKGTFDPKIKNPDTSASGLCQMIKSTSVQYGLGPDASKASFQDQAEACARFTSDNKNRLAAKLDRNPTNGELYLSHLLGPAGHNDFMQYGNNESSARSISAGKRKSNRLNHKDGTAFTIGEVKAWADRNMQSHMDAVINKGLYSGRDLSGVYSGLPPSDVLAFGTQIEALRKTQADEEKKRQDAGKKAFDGPAKERDTVAWVIANDPTLEKTERTYAAMFDPSSGDVTFDQKADSMKNMFDARARSQIAFSGFMGSGRQFSYSDVRLLTKDEAQAYVAGINEEPDGVKAMSRYQSIEAHVGPEHWPKVFQELMDNGLNSDWEAVSIVDANSDPNDIRKLTAVLNIDPKVLADRIPSDVKKGIDEGIQEQTQPFRSVYGHPVFNQNSASADGLINGLVKVAYDAASRDYGKVDAAERAIATAMGILNRNVPVLNESKVKVIIPRTVREQYGVTDEDVRLFAQWKSREEQVKAFEPRIFASRSDDPNLVRPTGRLEDGNIELEDRVPVGLDDKPIDFHPLNPNGPMFSKPDERLDKIKAISVEEDGKHYVVPTIGPTGKLLTDKEAIQSFKDTHEHLSVFSTKNDAFKYSAAVGLRMKEFYGLKYGETIRGAMNGEWTSNADNSGLVNVVKVGVHDGGEEYLQVRSRHNRNVLNETPWKDVRGFADLERRAQANESRSAMGMLPLDTEPTDAERSLTSDLVTGDTRQLKEEFNAKRPIPTSRSRSR